MIDAGRYERLLNKMAFNDSQPVKTLTVEKVREIVRRADAEMAQMMASFREIKNIAYEHTRKRKEWPNEDA